MPSDKQLAANRANAKNSTGPRSPAGKARASQNARKHAFSGDTFTITTIEDQAAIDHLRADLIALHQPANSQELFAIERIALAQHTLLRIARLESGLCTTGLNKILIDRDDTHGVPLFGKLHDDSTEIQAQNYYLAHGFHKMNVQASATWSLFIRYQAQAERHYRRAVDDLQLLIQLRPTWPAIKKKFPNEPNFAAQLEENPTASPSENEPISDTVEKS